MKNLKFVFLFWFFSATLDWIITAIGVFIFKNGESEAVPLYFIENYGILGFIFIGFVYLLVVITIYETWGNICNRLCCCAFLLITLYHIFGAWTQFMGIIVKLNNIISNDISFIIFVISIILLYFGTNLITFYIGMKTIDKNMI